MNNFLESKAFNCSTESIQQVYAELEANAEGLSSHEANKRSQTVETRQIENIDLHSMAKILVRSFTNPFSVVLLVIIFISFFTDILLKSSNNRNYLIIIIMVLMFLLSGIVRFIQEVHSLKVFNNLMRVIDNKVFVLRDGKWQPVSSEKLVHGDIVKFKNGDHVPADIRIIESDNCFVSQSYITGESESVYKNNDICESIPRNINECKNIIFAKSNLTAGDCKGIVVAVGKETLYGDGTYKEKHKRKGFNEGSNSIALVLIRFMAMIVPIVFVVTGFTQDNWLTAVVVALSVSIGLTPELLPMVITACLAKGSHNMGKNQTIVKNVNAMQAFGEMDVLCVDKTGTLTNDKLILEYYTDVLGNESKETLDYAYLNSYFRNGLANHIDNAILSAKTMPNTDYENMVLGYEKIQDHSFDYEKKYSSVELCRNSRHLLIVKGNVENIIKHCRYIRFNGNDYPIGDNPCTSVKPIVDEMCEDGMKVIAVAVKEGDFKITDEEGLTLIGYIAFFDAPKQSAIEALDKLKQLNINIKVLTGDNCKTTQSICKRLNMDYHSIISGSELAKMSEDEFQISTEKYDIFVELNPKQKAEIIEYLKINGHHVGFLGDGMNDLSAFSESDVAISVENALPSVKETADVILLKKDLNVLINGVLEGRKAFVNMKKYVKITTSSNLGNIISIIFASLLLPFLPMTSVQLLLLNLLYDILCLVLPWDNADKSQINKPSEWSGRNLSKFMLFFGPISSLFDLITFLFLFFVLCPAIVGGNFAAISVQEQSRFISLFQTGWFLESMWSQILILFSLRTDKLSIFKSNPSKTMTYVTFAGILLFTLIAMAPFGELIGLVNLPIEYFIFLFIVVAMYLLVVTYVKKYYIKRFGNLI